MTAPKVAFQRGRRGESSMTLTPIGRKPIEFHAKDAWGLIELLAKHILDAEARPLAPEVPPRRDGLREALATHLHAQHKGQNPEWTDERCLTADREKVDDILSLLHDAGYILAATRTPEPPDSGDGAAPRLVDDQPCAVCGTWRRFHLNDGSRMPAYSRDHPWRAEPRDAGIDAALLAKAVRWVLGDTDVSVVYDGARWREYGERIAAEYARLRSGSPAPEGGE